MEVSTQTPTHFVSASRRRDVVTVTIRLTNNECLPTILYSGPEVLVISCTHKTIADSIVVGAIAAAHLALLGGVVGKEDFRIGRRWN